MAKKYSVNIENDEVVSVEVDGVQYQSPDDISDPVDREKINDLIVKLTSDENSDDADDELKDFDKEFENFDKEFEEAQKESKKWGEILIAIFVGIAILMFAIAAFASVLSIRQISKEQSTPGQIVDLVIHKSFDSETQENRSYSYPVVEYSVPGKSLLKVELSEGEWPPSYDIGDQVTILYDPDQPRNARIQSASSNVLLWIVPGITGIIGIAFLFAAFIAFKLKD